MGILFYLAGPLPRLETHFTLRASSNATLSHWAAHTKTPCVLIRASPRSSHRLPPLAMSARSTGYYADSVLPALATRNGGADAQAP